jgi:hypothetical protein
LSNCRFACRCGGIAWGNDSLALLYESWYKTRRSRVWVLAPGDSAAPPALLWDRDYEDAYTDPGSPATRRTKMGTYVLATLEGTRQLIMQGTHNNKSSPCLGGPHGMVPVKL